MRNNKIIVALNLFLLIGFGTTVFSQDFPTKPIRFIIPYSPGGGNDLLLRAIQAPLVKALGKPIIIENVPAGNTKVGTMRVFEAKPDGYTLLETTDSTWIGYYYSKTFDFKLWEKMTPIGNLTHEPNALIEIRADAPYGTWGELVKYAKEHPGKLTCGGPGSGGNMEQMFNEMMKAGGINCRYVPFPGSGASKTALLGGHIDFRIGTAPDATPTVKAGTTKAIAISLDKRYELMPDVPSFKELGINSVYVLTRAVWGPPNMPQKIANIISKAIEKSIKDPEVIKLVEGQLVFKLEFMDGPKMKQGLDWYDKTFGPGLAEAYKESK